MIKTTGVKKNSMLLDLFEGLLTQPTAPFRESWVKRAVRSFAEDLCLPVAEDDIGNLWIGATTMKKARQASLVFVAHLDHPGIIVTSFEKSRGHFFAEGEWLGGGPMDIRMIPAKIFSDASAMTVLDGIVQSHTKGPRGPQKVIIKLDDTPITRATCNARGFKDLGPWGACLWYDKLAKGVKLRKDALMTKAADDLVGVCALLEGLYLAQNPPGVVVLLTRAEESGFHGTLDVLKRKLLDPKKTLMISIETSSQLPGGALGKGPVVRLGDRATVFDPAFTSWVQSNAEALAAKDKGFRYQRRLMDGGTCEATAFNCFGFRVAGLSTPLKNYHNISASGRPLPEEVSIKDVERLTRLITMLMRESKDLNLNQLSQRAFKDYREKLMKNQRAHEKYF